MQQEAQLLKKISKGDRFAFTSIFNLYRDKLYSFSLRLTGSSAMAEDMVQDVFVKVWQGRKELAQVRSFNAYLFKITRNHCLNLLKRMAHERVILRRMQFDSPKETANASPMEDKELKQIIQEAMNQLPSRQKLVYEMGKEKGLSHHEIALRLNLSVSTVKSHSSLAVKAVRDYIRVRYPVTAAIAGMILIAAYWAL